MAQNTILIVDDNRINRWIIANILSAKYLTLEAENGKEALEVFNQHAQEIGAIMIDLIMPEMDGFTFLSTVRDDERFCNIPIIITTGNDQPENEIKALELGAWDFVSKPYNAKIINFRLNNAIVRSQLSSFQQLKYLAEYDTLTGIYNKTKFFEATRLMIDEHDGESFVFLRFDIDRFQLINSFFGTAEGDRLLKYIAEKNKQIAKQFSLCTYGRIESDVFSLCLLYDETKVKNVLHSIRKLLAEYNPNYDIVPSIGLYIIDNKELPIEKMHARAKLAAKKCKGSYVQYYAYYDEAMGKKIEKEQEITNDMTTALSDHQFKVYYQPKFDVRLGKSCGAEALVRWCHPIKGVVSPSEFIPIFETNGFITELDYYVWEEVCKTIRGWLDEGKNVYPISVNVSRVELYNPRLVDIITTLTSRYQVPMNLFHLELTEGAYTDNPLALIETMKKFQDLGFVILMDDFGSGYSSLNILKDIAVDIIKIDMRFFTKAAIEGRGESIIASVVRMAKWLHIPVVAEGVETKEQVDFLRGIGCEYVQGFYYAKPMPRAQYEELLTVEDGLSKKQVQNSEKADLDVLWSSSTQMELLFSNISQPALICEYEEGHVDILRANDAYHELVGYDEKIFEPDDSFSYIAGSDYQKVNETFKSAVAFKEAGQCEYYRTKVNGDGVWIQMKIKYITQVGSKAILCMSMIDITEHKKFENELKRYRETIVSGQSGKKTMLIVDDAKANRTALKETFYNDYHLLETTSGEHALEILNEMQGNIDIILLDFKMPVMDGKEFLSEKEKNPKFKDIPVVVITADENPDEQLKALSFGISDYIVKPFVPEIAIRRVQNVMESTISRKLIRDYAEDATSNEKTGIVV